MQLHYLQKKKLWLVPARICINDGSFQTDMYNNHSRAKTGNHNKETQREIIFHKELRKARFHQTGMSIM